MFLKSLDTSSLRKDVETLFGIFDIVVQEIDVEYIVQFITDNDSSYKATTKKKKKKKVDVDVDVYFGLLVQLIA